MCSRPLVSDAAKEHKRLYDRARYLAKRDARRAARPPDPLLALPAVELAYIAGLIDGEGSVHTAVRRKSKTIDIHLSVGMTNAEAMEWLRQRLGVRASYLSRKPGYLRPQVIVRLSGNRLKLLCRLLQPYLIVKAQHARLACEFPTEARIAPGVFMPPAIAAERLRIRQELQRLNARTGRGSGVTPPPTF
jgi:hypothetical protein